MLLPRTNEQILGIRKRFAGALFEEVFEFTLRQPDRFEDKFEDKIAAMREDRENFPKILEL